MEKLWRSSIPRYSYRVLLKIFPEAKKIIPAKIDEWREELKGLRNDTKNILQNAKQKAGKDYWFIREYVRIFFVPEIIEAERQMKRLEFLDRIAKGKTSGRETHFAENLERARNYPIEEIARQSGLMSSVQRNNKILCPFHEEKTPSCHLYIESRTFHCFGCGEHGDNIKLTEKIYGLDFKEAVELLANL